MPRKLVFNAMDVKEFSPSGAEDSFISRMLIDDASVGSSSLVLNHFTLKPGKSTGKAQAHPNPWDEVYYILSGHGRLRLGDPPEVFELLAGTVVFIPSETLHAVDNTGLEDLKMLTMMPGPLSEGANPLYDERIRVWGTSFQWADAGQATKM